MKPVLTNQERYEEEQRSARRRTTLAYLLTVLFFAFVGLLYSGRGLEVVLSSLGLDFLLSARGTRIDCSKDGAENDPNCRRAERRAAAERQWRSLDPRRGGGAAFSLNEKR